MRADDSKPNSEVAATVETPQKRKVDTVLNYMRDIADLSLNAPSEENNERMRKLAWKGVVELKGLKGAA